jgi:membrane protease YdiL (CAAX protease family)
MTTPGLPHASEAAEPPGEIAVSDAIVDAALDPGEPPKRDLRLAIVVTSGLFFAAYSHLYDRWQLPPRFGGSVGLILGGDVLPLLVGPLLVIWLLLREPPGRYGWRLRPLSGGLRNALLAYLSLLPLVAWLSTRPEFQSFYPSPQFAPARESAIGLAVLWTLHHGLQLFSTEFLFRGFLLLPLARRFGLWPGIAAMLVLYVILHLAKPPLELLLATLGGVSFSLAAWRSQSFLPAFVAHWLVAVTMDLLCFLQTRPGP